MNQLKDLFKSYDINGYLVPSWDEFQNEFYSPKRLSFISGFTGSNGIAIILERKNLFFTDGRYISQAQKELDLELYDIYDIKELNTVFNRSKLITNMYKIGYDPGIFTPLQLKLFNKIKIIPINENLVDLIWHNKPKQHESNIFIYPENYSDKTCKEKIQFCLNILKQNSIKNILITDPATICWVLNIRSNDIETSPILLSYLILNNQNTYLLSNTTNFNKDIINYFTKNNIICFPLTNVSKILSNLQENVVIDDDTCPSKLITYITNAEIIFKNNIFTKCKACNSQIELSYIEKRNIEDSIILCEFFSWLEDYTTNNEYLTEYQVTKELTKFRKQNSNFICNSFPTICGYKENSAIIHYTPNKDESKLIDNNGMLLIDSGGHYYGATTDITRTIFLGTPTIEQRKEYTLVLKGHINLLQTIFPQGTKGNQLDCLARLFLWNNGLDYPHGTGHGVGNCLNVHEGPQAISQVNNTVLEIGMVLSNEPGYYKPGHYGIRIENLMYIKKSNSNNFLCFHNLTFIPYYKKLILTELLDNKEISYIKNYYATIKNIVYLHLSNKAQKWLDKELNFI